ncbi:MAG: hypothetical protein F4Y91_09900 [Gemmatimonadetes bacterium]|nr:hypothetical protein [Gemmatimonadota bacterium]MYB68125.1 hypothetical protein [Gemmatimonadota bacterium]
MLRDLREGRSMLGLLPEGVDSSLLRSALLDGLEHFLHIEKIAISDLDAQMPAAALGQAMRVDWNASTTPRTVENLLKKASLPEVLFLEDFNELTEKGRVQWLQFMARWARECQGGDYADTSPPALCLLAEAAKVPYSFSSTKTPLLSIHVWRGIPATAEMQMLCQRVGGQDTTPLRYWKEYTIPSIAGSDLELADYLWEEEYCDGRTLAVVLKAFAEKRDWNQAELQAYPVHGPPQGTAYELYDRPLSSSLHRAWSRGIVHWTKYGLDCNSAVLAMLGEQEALDFRLWRGLNEFISPSIERTRLALCDHFTKSYGPDWPLWKKPESNIESQAVSETPFACSWGHLKFLLDDCPELAQEKRRWYRLVQCLWRIRNELSHGNPISLQEYEEFCRAT